MNVGCVPSKALIRAARAFAEVKRSAEFGYWIGRPYWGQGYASAAGALALEMAFREWDMDYVFATSLVRNRASGRVLEKLGFRFIRHMDNPFPKWAPGDQMAYYDLTGQDYGS